MVLDSKLITVKQAFGIYSPEDWTRVRPEWILKLDGIGPVTLDMIRIWLATRDLTLLDDGTPELWRQRIGEAKISGVMGEEDIAEACPFTVIIDQQEKQPFGFQNVTGASGVPLLVPIEWKSLGVSCGDYSIAGHEGHCVVERKSLEDAHGTILGWGDRRDRFRNELENLATYDVAAIVLETSLEELLATVRQWGKKTADENRKILFRQVLAWQQDYRVPWIFAGSRQLAELATFRILERYWRRVENASKAATKKAEKLAPGLNELVESL